MSKFGGILKTRQPGAAAIQHSDTPKLQKAETPATQETKPGEIRVGRPRAKRSDPEYQQVTAYIRRDTYAEARKRLFDEDREFSELVEKLVADWLKGVNRRKAKEPGRAGKGAGSRAASAGRCC